ncbi:ABC transporter ATP-binding protein [Segnochrobactrum spirostomi]|uniref:ABC transporter ATP-binding protein n=1 Tax=Segnochrobactrum spirostomi TaxID=2608987 RepID=A0A6A7Y7R0_9HYPH|nr:ABC transporter ATP-binding protein [Segnochrobactrum spirostomi]MQT13539.1 ABC transporter ATP-binding protein [Segnochrobactrum spirostomi]
MIELDHATKLYGGRPAVDDVSLTIAHGEICALLGTSGSGKSTTLRLINRLVGLDGGRIRLDGTDIATLSAVALRRRIGYVIQSIGLFPHWTIGRNVGTVPRLLGWPEAKIRDRVEELLTLVGLDPALYRDRYGHELSGGQQQRVGVARALAADPDVLLMDEPFGALDPVTREGLQAEVARIHKATGKTIVIVTHDVDEAITLASHIALMEAGRVVQHGTPRDILAAPASPFVANFVGGAKAGLRLLKIETVGERVRREVAPEGEPVAASASLDEALGLMIARGARSLPVSDGARGIVGVVRLADLVEARVA